jgi:hypothetical protein
LSPRDAGADFVGLIVRGFVVAMKFLKLAVKVASETCFFPPSQEDTYVPH